MKLTLKIFCLSMATLMMTACFSPNPTPVPEEPNTTDIRGTDEYKKRREGDKDRDDVIRKTRNRYSGDVCEELDRKDRKDCEEICKDIYKDRGDRNECEELEVNLIEDLKEVYEALEDGDEDDFREIDSELFDAYLNTGISGLDDIIEDYSSKEAKEFLLWLIEDQDISNVFIKEDDDYKILITLFKAIDSDYKEKTETWKIFDEKIDSSDKLMEVVLESGSEEMMDWFLSYINDINTACEKDTESPECFTVYCKIGNDLQDDDDKENWHEDFEDFQDYLDDIISEETNRAKWQPPEVRSGGTKENDIEDLDDLLDEQSSNDTWVEALCAGLT